MPEQPILTIGEIIRPLENGAFQLTLPNGKVIPGHLPMRLSKLGDELKTGDRVNLEMTPYDFDKARIVGLADHV